MANQNYRIVKIKTSDNVIFEVPRDIARMCGTFETFIVELGLDHHEMFHDVVIPINTVTSSAFRMVLDWCYHHRGNPPVPRRNKYDKMNEWDEEFLSNLDSDQLFDICMASNALEIEALVCLSSAIVARVMDRACKKKLLQDRDRQLNG